MPVRGLRCTRATVAAVFSPLKVPVMLRVLPDRRLHRDVDRHHRQARAILRCLRLNNRQGADAQEEEKQRPETGHGRE
jgi:hypothetical protein